MHRAHHVDERGGEAGEAQRRPQLDGRRRARLDEGAHDALTRRQPISAGASAGAGAGAGASVSTGCGVRSTTGSGAGAVLATKTGSGLAATGTAQGAPVFHTKARRASW